jgi:hypothetical protein
MKDRSGLLEKGGQNAAAADRDMNFIPGLDLEAAEIDQLLLRSPDFEVPDAMQYAMLLHVDCGPGR